MKACIYSRFSTDRQNESSIADQVRVCTEYAERAGMTVAARFEAFCGGIELANGFHELNDALEQRRRFVADVEKRRAAGRGAPPIDEQLLRALPSLPDCAGVALGFDRLVALATGHDTLEGVVAFAHRKD